MAKLKVFRTSAGFDDAYVAAPSRKAALEAWGADVDLFARGVAELVTDVDLTREPLTRPGEVIRRRRGTAAEHLRALGKTPASTHRPKSNLCANSDPAKTRPVSKPARVKPRPNRAALEQAERALAEAETERDRRLKDIAVRKQALEKEQREIRQHYAAATSRLEERLDRERERFSARLDAWAEKG